jgi:hypothetical protein
MFRLRHGSATVANEMHELWAIGPKLVAFDFGHVVRSTGTFLSFQTDLAACATNERTASLRKHPAGGARQRFGRVLQSSRQWPILSVDIG